MRWVSQFYREREPLRRRVRELAASGGTLLLDAGCRKGEVTGPLAGAGRRVIGVDRTHYGDWTSSPTAVEFICADVVALPFGEGTFDRVVSSECLQYVPDWRRALEEVRRVLRPGGTLVLTCPNGVVSNRMLDPYVWHDRVLRLLDPARARAVEHRPASRIGAVVGDDWETSALELRGTPLYIWAAAAMETLERVRMVALRRRGFTHEVVSPLLLTLIRVLAHWMVLDFSIQLGRLSYNAVFVLRKPLVPGR